MCLKILKILAASFLGILVLWIGINQIPTSPRTEISSFIAIDESIMKAKNDWDHPLFQFLQNTPASKSHDPETLKEYGKLMMANQSFPPLPQNFDVATALLHHSLLNAAYLETLDTKPAEEQLDYLVATFKLNEAMLNQKLIYMSFHVELMALQHAAKYLKKHHLKFQALSSSAAHKHLTEIKIFLGKIVENRLALFKRSIETEREFELSIQNIFKASDYAFYNNKLTNQILDILGAVFYNKASTQNVTYENFDKIIGFTPCLKNFSCQNLCKEVDCSESALKEGGNYLINPVGMYLVRMSIRDPKILTKVESRFITVKETHESL